MRYFMTYGDQLYAQSKKRLAQEAEATGLFDHVKTFSPDDLPESLKTHPLMQYRRGGGYWLWKPYLINEVLKTLNENDILVYADSGCSINQSDEWNLFFNNLKHKSVVLFCLGYQNKYYCRQSLLTYASQKEAYWGNYQQVLSGFIILRKTQESCNLITDWLQLMSRHPEYVMDVNKEERCHEAPYFREKRHDQSALNACLYNYRHSVCLRWENVELLHPFNKQALLASRLSDKNPTRTMPAMNLRKYFTRTFIGRPLFTIRHLFWEQMSRLHPSKKPVS